MHSLKLNNSYKVYVMWDRWDNGKINRGVPRIAQEA